MLLVDLHQRRIDRRLLRYGVAGQQRRQVLLGGATGRHVGGRPHRRGGALDRFVMIDDRRQPVTRTRLRAGLFTSFPTLLLALQRRDTGEISSIPDMANSCKMKIMASMAGALAAVDVEHFAGHKAGPFEVEDRVDDIGNLAQPADWLQSSEVRVLLDGMHWRLDVARRDRVHSDAAFGILDCQRFRRGIQATLRERRQHGGYASDGVLGEGRGYLYNMAAALLLHLGDGQLRDVKEARDIDAQDRLVGAVY